MEEFDSKDRALVWRVTGGRTRTLLGGTDQYVKDEIVSFREAAISLMKMPSPFSPESMNAEQKRLAERLQRFGDCKDAPDIWRAMQIGDADRIADMPFEQFTAIAANCVKKEGQSDAR